jgi:hypothetical protein
MTTILDSLSPEDRARLARQAAMRAADTHAQARVSAFLAESLGDPWEQHMTDTEIESADAFLDLHDLLDGSR